MMMIRSQDRKWLVPLNRGVYVRSDDSAKDYQILLDNGDPAGNGDLPLGKYPSEARCLEVLDEIQKAFENYMRADVNNVPTHLFDYPKVYEMP